MARHAASRRARTYPRLPDAPYVKVLHGLAKLREQMQGMADGFTRLGEIFDHRLGRIEMTLTDLNVKLERPREPLVIVANEDDMPPPGEQLPAVAPPTVQ